jgi:Na+/melibiose symporter-like transporter
MSYDEIRMKEGMCLRMKRFFFVKLKDQNFLKGISTICGASLLNLIAGSVFSVCQLMIYEISYIHHANPGNGITSDNETFYYPVELLSQTIATFFSAILDKKLGLHYTNLIGMVILIIGYFILLFSKSFAADIVSLIFSGVGTGIISYPSTAMLVNGLRIIMVLL